MPTLEDLPVELLLQIHLQSLSSALPYVSRYLHSVFASSSDFHRAHYLFLRHDRKTLSHAVKYSICSLGVIHVLEKLAHARGKKLKCPQLPRRLVKGLSRTNKAPDHARDQVDLPLITYLLDTYHASPNSKEGYPLARAVFARHLPLIRLLLEYGADPGLKDGWAVTTAIANGDEDLVRMLMEKEVEREGVDEGEVVLLKPKEAGGAAKKRRRESGGGGGKRRKIEDRCRPTQEMLETAVRAKQWGIVDYLTAKGALPNINVLKML
ncbi:SPOSA6832_02596 [Sporobolomyces salmonicolor]|uniref:SPOSA6832_02596-mRNA-1:cds n=1 Tax=Sporidiobolus salmonicolor TaxID=5005 RepID=A0A0D6ELR2_SPOSA|nr:SPOSA6832_02596 [Sporobolomyces salmonicolor]